MNKNRAVELLKQALSEVPHLRTLHLGNKEFDLWRNKVSDIVEVAFGKSATEYERFVRAVRVDFPTYTEAERQKEYNRRLDEYETALKSIIQKYEMLGIEEKSTTIADLAETPKDYEARQGKQSVGKESRKHLQGTPEEIAPHIVRVAQEFQFQGFKYLAQEVSYKSSQFSKEFTILCGEYVGPQIRIIGDVEDEEHPKNRHIGTIILQSLANNKTLFISKKKSDDLVDADSYFGSYLNNALKELRELGFVESWPNKAWHVLKELVGVYKVVKP
ncbi:hypothetical protein ES703_84299 [subsurface metagenome]